ncbi:hypothetical protein EVAR_91982_1 [Eumeta japonica]|uniref:Uncharacterized protein n=1 Tax=Eumeta variegata TaxID=151549 RepID=A0A4C2AGA4_EUMVA|nr:hypothetical protein EVAR_91982_1 [Eumeta japonica]
MASGRCRASMDNRGFRVFSADGVFKGVAYVIRGDKPWHNPITGTFLCSTLASGGLERLATLRREPVLSQRHAETFHPSKIIRVLSLDTIRHRSAGLSVCHKDILDRASTPAVAAGIVWLYGPKIRKLKPCGERCRRHPPAARREGEHPRLYKQGHPKGAPVRVQRPTGSNKRKQPAAGSSVQQRRRRFNQNPFKWRSNRPSHWSLRAGSEERRRRVLKKEDLSVAAFGLP